MKQLTLCLLFQITLLSNIHAELPQIKSNGLFNNLKEIVIALKPDKNPDQMLSERKTLETELSKALKHPVKVIIPTSSAVIMQGFANGTIDLGYLSSLDMVNAENAKSANLLLIGKINGKTSYDSLWLVKNTSPYTSIKDLKNKPIAFASRTSTSGFLIPYWDLIKKNLLKEKQDTIEFFGKGNVWYGTGYVSAIQRVLDGTSDAAAVSDYVFEKDKHLTTDQKSKLKILQRQGPVPTHVIAVRNSLSEMQVNDIKKSLLKFNNTHMELADKIFSSELVDAGSQDHLKTTREALKITGLTIETK